VFLNYCKQADFDGGLCLTQEEFTRRHAVTKGHGKINPVIEHDLWSVMIIEHLSRACIGKGLVGRVYRLGAQMLPLVIKIYGKYNELGIIPLPPLFQKDGPDLYGI
jgi:hypothetical protein